MKTVQRDLDVLRDYYRAPLIYEREANGWRYDPNADEFELPGLWFNESELYALLAAEQLLSAVQPGLLAAHLKPLRDRIRSLLRKSGHSPHRLSEKIRLQPFARRPVNDEIFGALTGAALNEAPVAITYDGRERGKRTNRLIHPYAVLHYRDNWYAVAFCERANSLRVFSVDRVLSTSVPVSSPRFRPISERKLNRFLHASFGIFAGEATAWATLAFSSSRARWVADEQWHPEQLAYWRDGTFFLQIPFADSRELLRDVLRFGADVEVISPPELRRAAAQELARAHALYDVQSPLSE